METNSTIITNSKFGKEYDYPITATEFVENEYDGEAGLNLGFLDIRVRRIGNTAMIQIHSEDFMRFLEHRKMIYA